MKLIKNVFISASLCFGVAASSFAQENQNVTVKYNSNKLISAYITYIVDGSNYKVSTAINIPLYKMRFSTEGSIKNGIFELETYKDVRNGKVYADAVVKNGQLTYGKAKETKNSVTLELPTFDLFSIAFQLSYFGKLPDSFQYTNGKKIYKMDPLVMNESSKMVDIDGVQAKEITYSFHGNDKKQIVVKKIEGQKYPSYLSYDKDGDRYNFKFDRIVQN
ncbi:hypothetical protein [Taylorella asinigenitalis]|uniref:Outer membrane protein n=1 Tax=Taylorella asinigenitalis (strain MCE3) TaxID=1008459 RepID=G4Q9Y1_TAYAM|nr:hypothetical protein [Taylorella asinigenitalis]AEP36900.1 hypothetical protein TASI_1146 [Taylorella asinigenitalis MCE3]